MSKKLMKKEQEPMTPGFGVAGQVMCPFSLMAPKTCVKEACEMWVELTYVDKKVARCAFAWNAVLMTELRMELSRLREALNVIKDEKDNST